MAVAEDAVEEESVSTSTMACSSTADNAFAVKDLGTVAFDHRLTSASCNDDIEKDGTSV